MKKTILFKCFFYPTNCSTFGLDFAVSKLKLRTFLFVKEMSIEKTKLEGCFIFTPRVFEDSRGYFFESYNKQSFDEAAGKEVNFVQDNQSKSSYGVLRGLHFQTGEHAQAKLVRVLEGEVLDVAVDLRENSPTYGQYESVLLTGTNNKQFFIPRGFAHGFVVLSETAVFSYKCDNFYAPQADGGLRYDDSDLNIDWQIPTDKVLLSEKDSKLPFFKDFTPNW